MSFFAKLEQVCASFIERAFAKTFPSDLEPAQIARKLVATMEAATRDDDGRLRAPGFYTVFVSVADYERLAEHRSYLERTWRDLLRNLAQRVGISFKRGELRVTMAARQSVPLGAIEIDTGADAATPSNATLRILEGVPPGAVYPVEETVRIGRSDECEIVLLDPGVSRVHAVVDPSGGTPTVRDLDSTNGTFVNGRRVKQHELQDGDELRLGNTRLRFESR